MNVSSIGSLADLSRYAVDSSTTGSGNKTSGFESIFQAMLNQVKETNDYTHAAQEAETSYALGLTDSISDLLVAQQKANLSLQYTVAIRNSVMDAYKEIMNLQF